MKRVLVILVILLTYSSKQIQGVTIEYPNSGHISERTRKDIESIDRILRYYIVPREIQYHADALQGRLPFFLQCKGSSKSIEFIVPNAAIEHLSLNNDHTAYTVTATLRRNQLSLDLIGRYTCSEIINGKKAETSAYVYIVDGISVFTKRSYPKVLPQTGVHFFNIPCQTASWYARMSCPTNKDSKQCKARECSPRERQVNELKCNIPICEGDDLCIPVYLNPADLQATKTFFDPQIGFALMGPNIPKSLLEFNCMSNYTPTKISTVPYDSFEPENVVIHQPSLNVMPDESVRLSCEIQYVAKPGRKAPNIFWFEDIYDLKLIANETDKAEFNPVTKAHSRKSFLTLRGFKPGNVYRFYCVRSSEQGLYSGSVEVTCVDTPVLDLDITSSNSDSSEKVPYGSDTTYDITIFTVPRSSIVLEVSRNGVVLNNDKRFEIVSTNNQEDQFHEYSLTIYNVTFEDETDLKIQAKSSVLEKSQILKPYVIGDPVGQFAFLPNDIPRSIPWRDEGYKNKQNIHAYGIYENESFRVVCTVRHRSDIPQPLNIFIHQIECKVDNCLENIIDNACRSTTGQRLTMTKANQINNYQTQFISSTSQKFDDPTIGHQYICCYDQSVPLVLAKGLTAVAQNREMFTVRKPEFSLVTGDVLTYRCASHDLIYDNLRMIYNDGLSTYQRNRFDPEWYLFGTRQPKEIDLKWTSPISEDIRDTAIEVSTLPLKRIGKNGYIQCIALSRRNEVIPSRNDTYYINVDDPVQLQFKNNLPSIVRINEKASTDIEFDCSYIGRPQPKVAWLKGKLPLVGGDSTLQFRNNNGSIFITRAQPSDTGYYTCGLTNGRDVNLTRSFDLRIKGPYISSKFRRLTAAVIAISALLIVLLLILLIIVAIKYFRMKKIVDKSYFNRPQSEEPEDKSLPPMTQLTRIPLPGNFASTQQVRTLLSYVNGDTLPAAKEDFKELGHGQYGVVYQVNLPEAGLVAAKLLPQSIRNVERRRDKRKKSGDIEESQEMIEKNQEDQKKKAAEMLIDEIKVMYKAGKHINIVSLLKVAYPEAKFRNIVRGGVIRDEDSFYLMELCSNGSLESMLKHFLQAPSGSSEKKLSLYETLSKQNDRGMTLTDALSSCQLTDDDLKLIAYQVASGVDYLNRIQIAHCDIAARNVLVNSRFIMKICDFGLATWTTYKNYREQLAQRDSVQLEKKNNELATHNLTPELARAFLRASTPDERVLLNKPSMKSDVWSFGIFLWTLFLKCQIRPFNRLSEEVKHRPGGQSFFHQLARVVSEGRVLEYIDYRSEIPDKIYAIIRLCLVDESERPEMSRIRSYLCHQNMLSKQAFEYYRSEYNHYQEEIATDGNVLRFGEDQGVSALPAFDGKQVPDDSNSGITFRHQRNPANDYYPTPSERTSASDKDYPQPGNDSYLEPTTQPRTIAGKISDELAPLVRNTDDRSSSRTTSEVSVPIKNRAPTRPAPPPPPPPPPPSSTTKRDESGDSYV